MDTGESDVDLPIWISLVEHIRQDPTIIRYFELDPGTAIYHRILYPPDIHALLREYPGFFPRVPEKVYCLNVFTSKMVGGKYLKSRFYFDPTQSLLKRLESG